MMMRMIVLAKYLMEKTATKNGKSSYFESLEQSGYSPQKLKRQSSKSPKKNASPQKKRASIENPYSSRGAPLGKKRGGPLGGGGKKKKKFVNGNMAMGSLLKQKSDGVVRKE